MKKASKRLIYLLIFFCTTIYADSKIQNQFSKTFNNITVEEITESPIKGLMEMRANGKIVYYYPEKDLIFLGAIFDKNGNNLTEKKEITSLNNKINRIDKSPAFIIGDTNAKVKIIEFTDTDCPFCRKANEHFQQKYKDNKNIVRYIYLTPIDSLHPKAYKEAIHALCTEEKNPAINKNKLITQLLSNEIKYQDMKSCEAGKAKLKKLQAIKKEFSISGTPTFFINGKKIIGARIDLLDEEINKMLATK